MSEIIGYMAWRGSPFNLVGVPNEQAMLPPSRRTGTASESPAETLDELREWVRNRFGRSQGTWQLLELREVGLMNFDVTETSR